MLLTFQKPALCAPDKMQKRLDHLVVPVKNNGESRYTGIGAEIPLFRKDKFGAFFQGVFLLQTLVKGVAFRFQFRAPASQFATFLLQQSVLRAQLIEFPRPCLKQVT